MLDLQRTQLVGADFEQCPLPMQDKSDRRSVSATRADMRHDRVEFRLTDLRRNHAGTHRNHALSVKAGCPR